MPLSLGSESSTRRWIVSRASWLKAFALAATLLGFQGAGTARAQDWTDYLHWPYVPPQTPANGSTTAPLYDGFYLYPREQRIVPQIQGPYYRNFYGGYRVLGLRHPHGWHDWNKKKFYQGYHFYLDVF
jgi:hypothetical protein